MNGFYGYSGLGCACGLACAPGLGEAPSPGLETQLRTLFRAAKSSALAGDQPTALAYLSQAESVFYTIDPAYQDLYSDELAYTQAIVNGQAGELATYQASQEKLAAARREIANAPSPWIAAASGFREGWREGWKNLTSGRFLGQSPLLWAGLGLAALYVVSRR